MLTGEWVLVSPHRTQRPWKGQIDTPDRGESVAFDPECYLCPGNERAGGRRNPDYRGPFAFDNDFPALSPVSETEAPRHPLFVAEPESGCCRVVCYSQRHDLRLASMPDEDICRALEFMIGQFVELDDRSDIGYVQMFENRGQMMGCSNPHPHAQIWATSAVPVEPAKEFKTQLDYFHASGRRLLLDYLEAEIEDRSRIVCENDHAVALVPYWAVWPFETLLVPRWPRSGPEELGKQELLGFASVLRRTLAACDRLFDTAVPYSMGFHPRPSDGAQHPEWQFHAHVYPPLLRSATIRKHLVGFEMLGMPQRDITPEVAAQRLRDA
jgi:UDPglucose--hexose-1-phosphate uridylyltransferase